MYFYPKKIAETRLITRDVSIITFWLGMLFLIPMAIGLMNGEPFWWMYLPLILVTSGPSYLFIKFIKNDEQPFTRITIVTLAVMWVVFSIVGSYPFMAVAGMNPLNGYFESVSAISTTGITTIPHPELVPSSVLFWRAMLSWIGGIGITAFAFYSMLQSESISKIVLGEGYARLKPSIVNSAKEIFKIYVFWTALGVIAMAAIGLPILDSLNLAMNAISTTGFDVHTGGWAYYQANMPQAFPFIALFMGILMIMGAISFVVHYRVINNRRLQIYLQDKETRVFLMIMLTGAIFMAAYLMLNNQDPVFMSYGVISASTGGYETSLASIAGAADFVIALFIILTLIGGCSNSPSGGLKVRRVHMLFKYVVWRVGMELSPPGTISHFKYDGKLVDVEEIASIAVYAFIYCSAIIAVSMILISLDYPGIDSLLIVTSAQAGAGISPIPAWEFQDLAKVALIGTMFFGRLEFIPLFALGMYSLRKR